MGPGDTKSPTSPNSFELPLAVDSDRRIFSGFKASKKGLGHWLEASPEENGEKCPNHLGCSPMKNFAYVVV